MPKIGLGVPPPAKFENIIADLFQNEKTKNSDDTYSFYVFSQVCLNSKQKKSLTYPKDMVPIDRYIIYQVDKFDKYLNKISTDLKMVSFCKKNDKYIYGCYFTVLNQKRFSFRTLIGSSRSLKLNNPRFVQDNYTEVYHNVLGTTVILGSGTDNSVPFASLQYTNQSKYYYGDLSENGIKNPDEPLTVLIGLSNNLTKICKTR